MKRETGPAKTASRAVTIPLQSRRQPHREHPVHPAVVLVPEGRGDQERRAHQEDGAGKHEDIHQRQGQDDDRHGVGPDELPRHHAVDGAVELDDDSGKNGRRQVIPQRVANDMRIPDRLHMWLLLLFPDGPFAVALREDEEQFEFALGSVPVNLKHDAAHLLSVQDELFPVFGLQGHQFDFTHRLFD